jgi:hypothetical protein
LNPERRRLLSRRFVANHFYIVAVRVEDEGAVVVRMILGSRAWSAIVSSTGCERGLMKCVD